MPHYLYKVSDASGSVFETSVESENASAARKRLKQQKLTAIALLGEGKTASAGKSSSGSLFQRKELKVLEFTEQLAPLLQAGIELEAALDIIEDTLEQPAAKQVVREMRRGLHEGKRFSQLLESRSHIFPRLYARMVSVGEESGNLPVVMKELLHHLKQRQQLRSQLLSASIYPGIISFVSLCVVMFLLGGIVPKFAEVFAKSKKQPQGITALLFDISSFVQSFWWLIILIPIVTFVGIKLLSRQKRWANKFDAFLLKLPLIGQLVQASNLLSLVKAMSVMISSGVHLLQAVQTAANLLPNREIRQSVSEVAGRLRSGEKLSKALSSSPYLPAPVLKMLAVGEQTGKMEDMLERIGEQYDQRLQTRLKALTNAFEPLLIVGLGLVIGFIVLSMFLSISDMTSI